MCLSSRCARREAYYTDRSEGLSIKPERVEVRVLSPASAFNENRQPGSFEEGVPSSWGSYKGAGPLVRAGEARKCLNIKVKVEAKVKVQDSKQSSLKLNLPTAPQPKPQPEPIFG